MYDKLPAPLLAPFVAWARNKSIRVVHLVREASLLRTLSSSEAHHTHIYHTFSNQTQARAPAGVQVQLISKAASEICKKHHRTVAHWSHALHRPGIHYHYERYERLMFEPARGAILLGDRPAGCHCRLGSAASGQH